MSDMEEYLAGELRVLNAHLPSRQKTLAALLAEREPFVACGDDTTHLFDRGELSLLAGMLSAEEQGALRLPMLIEVGGSQEGQTALRCMGPVEEKVVAGILGMPARVHSGRIPLYKPQLAKLRGVLATTTQYVFLAGE